MKQKLFDLVMVPFVTYRAYLRVRTLGVLNLVLDGRLRRWLEGRRQKLDPWGTWMHSTFLDDAARNPNAWWGRTEGDESRTILDDWHGANLLHSRIPDSDQHILALDVDFPTRAVPSSTPGKGHIYVNKPLSWESVVKVLQVLEEVGVLHKNYVKHTTERGYTCLRPAFVRKPKNMSARFSSDFDADEKGE